MQVGVFDMQRVECVLAMLPSLWLSDSSLIAVALRLRAVDFCRAVVEPLDIVPPSSSCRSPLVGRWSRPPTLPQTIRRTLRRLKRRRLVGARVIGDSRRLIPSQLVVSGRTINRSHVTEVADVGENEEEHVKEAGLTSRSLPSRVLSADGLSDELHAISARLSVLRSRWSSDQPPVVAAQPPCVVAEPSSVASGRLGLLSEEPSSRRERPLIRSTTKDDDSTSSEVSSIVSPPSAARHRRRKTRRQRQLSRRAGERRQPSINDNEQHPTSSRHTATLDQHCQSAVSTAEMSARSQNVAASTERLVSNEGLSHNIDATNHQNHQTALVRLDLTQLSDHDEPPARNWTEIAVFERPSHVKPQPSRPPPLSQLPEWLRLVSIDTRNDSRLLHLDFEAHKNAASTSFFQPKEHDLTFVVL